MTRAALSAVLALFLGGALGMFYDAIRFLRVVFGFDVRSPFERGNKKRGKWVGYIFVSLSDFAFFLIAAIAMSVFFFLTGDGRVRGYVLFCTWLGFLAYYHTVGRLFIGISSYLVRLLKKAVRRVIYIAALPFVYIGKAFKKTGSRIFNLPIVSGAITRYNVYKMNRKKKAAVRLRKKRMQKSGYCYNGGAHEKGK